MKKYAMGKFDSGWVVADMERGVILFKGFTEEKAKAMLQFLADDTPVVMVEDLKPRFDFERIYREYPRKIGRATGMKWLQNHIRSEEKYKQLEQAVKRYKAYCAANVTESVYIQHFSTWVRRYEDWVGGEEKPKATVTNITDGIKF